MSLIKIFQNLLGLYPKISNNITVGDFLNGKCDISCARASDGADIFLEYDGEAHKIASIQTLSRKNGLPDSSLVPAVLNVLAPVLIDAIQECIVYETDESNKLARFVESENMHVSFFRGHPMFGENIFNHSTFSIGRKKREGKVKENLLYIEFLSPFLKKRDESVIMSFIEKVLPAFDNPEMKIDEKSLQESYQPPKLPPPQPEEWEIV